MKIELVAYEIQELLIDEIHMFESCFKISLLEERLSGLDYVPMIL